MNYSKDLSVIFSRIPKRIFSKNSLNGTLNFSTDSIEYFLSNFSGIVYSIIVVYYSKYFYWDPVIHIPQFYQEFCLWRNFSRDFWWNIWGFLQNFFQKYHLQTLYKSFWHIFQNFFFYNSFRIKPNNYSKKQELLLDHQIFNRDSYKSYSVDSFRHSQQLFSHELLITYIRALLQIPPESY